MDSGGPHRGLAAVIRVTRARIAALTGGRPTLGRQGQGAGLGGHDGNDVAPEGRVLDLRDRRGSGPEPAVVGSGRLVSGGALVPVMESAEVRNRHDPTAERGFAVPWVWAVLVQRLMWARGVVVDLVGPQEPVEVPLVQDEEVVEALASD
jgi:hypothetical protein